MDNLNQYLSLTLAISTVTIILIYFVNKIRRPVTVYNIKFSWNDNAVLSLGGLLFYNSLMLVADVFVFSLKIENFSIDTSFILLMLLTLGFHVLVLCVSKCDIDEFVDTTVYNLQNKAIKF